MSKNPNTPNEVEVKPRGFNSKRNIVIIVLAGLLALGGGITAIAIGSSNSASHSVASGLQLAERYLSELKYEQAIIEFERVLEIEPMNVDAYLGLADAYLGLGDTDKAVETLRKGLEITGDERLQKRLDEILNPPTTSSSSTSSSTSTSSETSSSSSTSSKTASTSSSSSSISDTVSGVEEVPSGPVDVFRSCDSAEAWANLLLSSADWSGTERLTDAEKIYEIFGVDVADADPTDYVFYYSPDETNGLMFAYIKSIDDDAFSRVSLALYYKMESLLEDTTLSPAQQDALRGASLGTTDDGYICYIVHPQGAELAAQLLVEE